MMQLLCSLHILCHDRGVIEIKCQPETCLSVDGTCQGGGRVRDCSEVEAQVCQIFLCANKLWLCKCRVREDVPSAQTFQTEVLSGIKWLIKMEVSGTQALNQYASSTNPNQYVLTALTFTHKRQDLTYVFLNLIFDLVKLLSHIDLRFGSVLYGEFFL